VIGYALAPDAQIALNVRSDFGVTPAAAAEADVGEGAT
jgi:hypothetical protein